MWSLWNGIESCGLYGNINAYIIYHIDGVILSGFASLVAGVGFELKLGKKKTYNWYLLSLL
jgi:hypothetical protein